MLKKLAQALFLLFALPPWLWWKCVSAIGNRDNSVQGVSQFLSLFPGKPGSLLRAAFYRLAFADTSQDSVIEFLATFSHSGARFGKHFYAGIGCNIGLIEADDDVMIGAYAYIASGRRQHYFEDPDTPIRLQGGERVRVRLGRDCWIGACSCVFADVGEGSIVAPNSVVIAPVPPFVVVGGAPARVLRPRKPGQS